MTANDILCKSAIDNDQSTDVAYALYQADHPVIVSENTDDGWKEKPIILNVYGVMIHLTAHQADAIQQGILAELIEYGEKLRLEASRQQANETTESPAGFGSTAHVSYLVDTAECDEAISIASIDEGGTT